MGKHTSDKVNKDQKKSRFLMSLKKMLFACFSSERFILFELGNALYTIKIGQREKSSCFFPC